MYHTTLIFKSLAYLTTKSPNEHEFNLSAEEAYDLIARWLVKIKAEIKDHNEPFYVKASHGSALKNWRNPLHKKTIEITLQEQTESGFPLKVHVKASLGIPVVRDSIKTKIRIFFT